MSKWMDLFYTSQFQNIPINVVHYNEQIHGDVHTDAYTITVNCPANRESCGVPLFFELGTQNWCLYVCGKQAGWSNQWGGQPELSCASGWIQWWTTYLEEICFWPLWFSKVHCHLSGTYLKLVKWHSSKTGLFCKLFILCKETTSGWSRTYDFDFW